MKVISLYRPSSEQAEGSLRKAGGKLVGKDLEGAIQEALELSMSNPTTLLMGDFNLDRTSAARYLLKAGVRNALCEQDVETPTFRRLVKGHVQESSVDWRRQERGVCDRRW